MRNDSVLRDIFKDFNFDEIEVYNFNYDTVLNVKTRGRETNIENFNYYITRKIGRKKLDSIQTLNFLSIINDTSTFGGTYAACFEPRLGFTFFNKNEIVFNILICFDCNYLISTKIIPATEYYYYSFETGDWDNEKQAYVPGSVRIEKYFQKGFSEMGRKRLVDLCHFLNMHYCID